MSDYRTLYVTCADKTEAKKIATALIEQKFAACGNIIENVTSIYHWDGQINEDNEVILLIKTRRDLVSQASELIKKLHSYDVPCIFEWKIESGEKEYFKWMDQNLM